MVICENYMLEFSVSKDMKQKNNNDKRRIRGYLLAFTSNTNCQRIEN